MENIIFRAIESKLNKMTEEEQYDAITNMDKYVQDYLKQFTLYKLDNIDLNEPDIDTLIFYLVYELCKSKNDKRRELNSKYNDLVYKLDEGLLTRFDIKEIMK